MKEIKLKFSGLGYCNINQACVDIYDECNKKICSGKTYNSVLKVKLKCNKLYKLVATSKYERINRNFYVNQYNNCYCFAFPNSLVRNNQSRIVTLLLSDYYYDNMPIAKGEIILWQK
ncbi:MAG: hypothetical protein IJ574_03485 [Bacilli bacterium]|nr:hypothetical protein [Bacilli bacterium]